MYSTYDGTWYVDVAYQAGLRKTPDYRLWKIGAELFAIRTPSDQHGNSFVYADQKSRKRKFSIIFLNNLLGISSIPKSIQIFR